MQVDVFSDGYKLTTSSTVAPASRLAEDAASSTDDGLPTLAQLLQETVNSLGVGTTTSSSTTATATSSGAESPAATILPALPSLPNLSSPPSRSYISALLSKDLPSLLKEPEELARQSELLDADLANLCYRSTGDLLGVGDCVDGVEDGFR